MQAHQVSLRLGSRWAVQGVSLKLQGPELVGLLGPNGAGKSSFLRLLYRMLRPHAGWVALEGRDLWQQRSAEVARRLAVVGQEAVQEPGFSLLEMVLMGRTPHKGWLEADSALDLRIAREALARVGLSGYEERPFQSLSGGEKQRALIARALAQQAHILLLDEPTNHLDVRYQLEVLQLVRGLRIPVVAALHDLNLAALFCDRLLLLSEGRVVAEGRPEQVLTAERLRVVYGVEALVEPHPRTGRPQVVLLPPEEA
ncbi:MAG: ABC transporter ATP-binding protein [Meiothermus sp.]|uniref:ABC transporter ATP-binding protein n=1 Tax=Meiothermus sp. TaxID=1955249 RepID=UPI0025FA0225|nr:ABC transporter ATP-binding protein [Meiothermus sp.]MCS7068192.1 ABC transporter ATP-binding protein [Meiothermus sp.]MCX7739624.1 ABC transporter ATP-binding protein [Meiothermus sp.]MDW8426729.1 ABC transporter ATP-binding protein [Meiothermus sp.]